MSDFSKQVVADFMPSADAISDLAVELFYLTTPLGTGHVGWAYITAEHKQFWKDKAQSFLHAAYAEDAPRVAAAIEAGVKEYAETVDSEWGAGQGPGSADYEDVAAKFRSKMFTVLRGETA